MNLLGRFKRNLRENVFPYTAWLPRYYILFKWADIPQEAVVLDLGCGEGYVTLRLAEKCRQVVGLDISTKPLQLANEKKSRSKFKHNIYFLKGNVLQLPFPEATFDLVVFLDALPEIEQDKQALAEIARVLKPSGRLVITVVWQYSCAGTLFKEQGVLKKIVPRFLQREYLPGGFRWFEADNNLIRQCWHIHHQYNIEELRARSAPHLAISRYAFYLKKYGALTTDITYGIKGFWTLRFMFLWLAVRMDYHLEKNMSGYFIIAELVKKET